MIDFHSHIVFGVDDGARNIDESVKMIIEAEKAGFTDIIFTPHYMEGYYEVSKDEISKRIELLKNEIDNNNLQIKLHQGNEVYITNNMGSLISEKKISTANGSKYVLFETPMRDEPINLLQVVYQILEAKKVPIIAHPERYLYIQENPNLVYELIDDGVLFQSNYGSLVGIYGKSAQRTLSLLLKHNMIHFMGSDVHRPNSIYPIIDDAIMQLKKIIPDYKISELTYENALKVLNDEDIEIEEPSEVQKNIFGKFI